ncbi:unnamed protein product [Lymnaea stagnalis]|uniref:ubiquitinyl hydrolase 1 n=1 Tax=Lymnaea stagnalis TaxID=6523 RepID=A0AAV2HHC5_LYMST
MQINSKANDYVKERGNVQQWIRSRVDYRSDDLQKPYTFVRDTSHHDCQLPAIEALNLLLKDLYQRSSLDQDMIDDLERAQVLNWCPRAIKLKAVTTPRDGNCLVHSVSLAIWGVEDSTNVLRDLLLITARNDFHNRFKKRWERQHLQDLSALVTTTLSISDQEWEDVIRSISNMGSTAMCAAVPHRFLESVHIYILANILRRPIIVVTDSLARSLTGQSLQANNIGGIYLPLEWDPVECCKTPIIIGYSLSHFCPLISELTDPTKAREESVFLFPLVNKDLSFLPIRYLTEEEERQAWDLVQKFFNMKELEVAGESLPTKIPCARMVFKPFEINLFNEHLKLCEQRCAAVMQAGNANSKQPATRNAKDQYFQIQLSSQTELVRMPLKSSSQENARLGPTVKNNCITKGCFNVGDPNQGNMCDTCLRNFTIAEAGRELISLQDGSLQYFAIDVPCNNPNNEATAATQIDQIVSSVIPTAPPPSGVYASEPEVPLSMLNDRCIKKCGYRSSSQTAPYCHQCFQLEQNKRQQREQAVEPTAPVESMIIGEGNVFIESELNIQDEDIIAMNSSSSGESSYLPSSISDILKQKDITGTEITWTEGGNIYSLKTPSAGHGPTASLCERSYSKLDELLCKRTGCEGVRLKEKDFCLKCSEELPTSGKLLSHVTPMTSEAKPSSAFPETITCNNNEDIEISAELSVRCAYQNCESPVKLPNKLCNKCQEILIELTKRQPVVGEKTRENVLEPQEPTKESVMYGTRNTQSTLQNNLSEDIRLQKELQAPASPWLKPTEMGHKINDVQKEKERALNESSTTQPAFRHTFNKIDDMQREKERALNESSTTQPAFRHTFNKIDDMQREKEKQTLELKPKDLRGKSTDLQRETERHTQQSSSTQSKFKFETENLSRRSSSLSPKATSKMVLSSRGKHCRISGCQNYGDPTEDNMCSSCYRKSLKSPFPTPRHLESRQLINTSAQHVTRSSEPAIHLGSGANKYGTSVYQSSSPPNENYLTSLATSKAPYRGAETREYVMAKVNSTLSKYEHESSPSFNESRPSFNESRPSFRHNVVTSMSSFASQYGTQEQPSPDLREADQRFNQAYEKTVRKGEQAKCKTLYCDHYGNPKKQGYCNACYNIYQQQKALETYGEDVPDKLK